LSSDQPFDLFPGNFGDVELGGESGLQLSGGRAIANDRAAAAVFDLKSKQIGCSSLPSIAMLNKARSRDEGKHPQANLDRPDLPQQQRALLSDYESLVARPANVNGVVHGNFARHPTHRFARTSGDHDTSSAASGPKRSSPRGLV
jgi:hypothetical protein